MPNYKVTYNPPKAKKYIVIEKCIEADNKNAAKGRAYGRNWEEYPDLYLYKAKKLKDGTEEK